jgi:hypothetical protein
MLAVSSSHLDPNWPLPRGTLNGRVGWISDGLLWGRDVRNRTLGSRAGLADSGPWAFGHTASDNRYRWNAKARISLTSMRHLWILPGVIR